jgi:hypothetical protein
MEMLSTQAICRGATLAVLWLACSAPSAQQADEMPPVDMSSVIPADETFRRESSGKASDQYYWIRPGEPGASETSANARKAAIRGDMASCRYEVHGDAGDSELALNDGSAAVRRCMQDKGWQRVYFQPYEFD